MADNRSSKYKVTKSASASKKKSPPKQTSKQTTKQDTKGTQLRLTERTDAEKAPSLFSQVVPYIVGLIAVFFALCIYFPSAAGVVGNAIHNVSFGLFSSAAYVAPLFLLVLALLWTRDSERNPGGMKALYAFITFILIAVIMHLYAGGRSDFLIAAHYADGRKGLGGGVFGGMIGRALEIALGKVGSSVIVIALAVIFTLLIFSITPRGLYVVIVYKIKMAKEHKKARELAAVEERDISDIDTPYTSKVIRGEPQPVMKEQRHHKQLPVAVTDNAKQEKRTTIFGKGKRKKFDPDVDLTDDYPAEPTAAVNTSPAEPAAADSTVKSGLVDEKIFDEVMKENTAEFEAVSHPKPVETDGAGFPDLDKVISNAVKDYTEKGTKETVKPVGEVDMHNDAPTAQDDLDLKHIFVNPDDKILLDKLADAYLNGETKTVSISGTTDAASLADTDTTDADIELQVLRRRLTETYIGPQSKPKQEYEFPPIDLLTLDTAKRDENIRDELYENADKLVETLNSFNVHTKIVDVSRGPTITRYELLPEAGTRVRSITNLVDDISLNLATTGVRIELIPGKAAVGIEVPNKNSAVVHLRTLIDDDRFRASKSNLNVALGEDVAGASIYLDIAKMPHLLIAGATGMGKSVCINSVITSLLYKAKPSEVKLILIDPKKVELNIYNGLPHLLTPVVSDPKKAAGSLSWAVNEMERRFSLIEDVGVRDLKSYNEITKGDPDREQLPQIVIIIDELADLMMTAPDDVETSICRLAQKARAAGMHLIIGTQRPSVDVITGLIKSNIPSRIAFTVASQIDSRTIIDRAGAESLIGRGDMLYNPVGAAKPIRVQGAFVSEKDVEKIVQFIKDHSGPSEYSSEVLEQIEKEAARCGTSKKSASAMSAEGGEGDEDPMLRSAVELAVESGKISTSLIQRRLSLGYGRAAKLIDRMEELGYVSAPDGQKPREVLITKEQFMEMVLHDEQ